jgi:hypothetical protein
MSETVTLYKCDGCSKIIQRPEDGLVVQGNIYVADPIHRGGLIGCNFPKDTPTVVNPKFTRDEVKESVFCNSCFIKAVLPNTKIATVRGGSLQT